ncbi:MAG: glycosyltransferase [Cyanobacteria bacterium J06642_2]
MNFQGATHVLHITSKQHTTAVAGLLELLHTSALADAYKFSTVELASTEIDWFQITHELRQAHVVLIHIPISVKTLPTIQEIGRLASRFGCSTVLVDSFYPLHAASAEGIQTQWQQWLFQAASQCVHCIASSSVVQGQWLQTFLDADQVKVIPACCDLNALRAIAPRTRSRDRLVAVAPGSQNMEDQGFDTILDAASRIRNLPIQILLAGNVPDMAELRSRAANVGNVWFVGPFEAEPLLFAAADIAILTPRRYPHSFEALRIKAAGKPAIVSQVDGLEHQFAACGLSIPAGNAAALARALHHVSTEVSQTQLHAWGQTGRASVQSAETDCISRWGRLLESMQYRYAVIQALKAVA